MDIINYCMKLPIIIYIGEVLLCSGRGSLTGSWSQLPQV